MSQNRELSSRKIKRKEEGTVPPAPETAGAPVPIFSMELPEGVFTNSHRNRSAQQKNNAEPVPSESSEKQSEKPLKEEKQKQKEKTEEKKQEKKEENRNKEKEKEKKEKKKIQLPSFSFAGKLKETAKKATEKKQKEDKAGTEFPIGEEKLPAEKQKAPEKSGDTILSWLVSIILCNIPAVDIIYFIVCIAKPVKSRKNWALASLIIACIRIAIIIGTVAFILSRSEKDLYNFFYSLSGSL